MKKIMMLTMCVVLSAVLFASCSYTHNDHDISIISDVAQVGQSDNLAEINNSARDALTSSNEKKGEIMFDKVSLVSVSGSDRMPRSASKILRYPEMDAKEKTGTAICIVTVLDINTSACTSDLGRRIPIKLRLDSIIGNNPAFRLNVDDIVLATDYSYWTKCRDGFSVNYSDGTIPITERNAQYIVLMYGTDEETKETVQNDIELSVEALTIPITGNENNVSFDGIYKYLKLPDDVIQCSKDLIDSFMNN